MLRFYINDYKNKEVERIIRNAEIQSYKICEICGVLKSNSIYVKDGYYYNWCVICRKDSNDYNY